MAPKVYKEQGGDALIVCEGGVIVVKAGAKIVIEEGGTIEYVGSLASIGAELLDVTPQPPIDDLPERTTVAETAGTVNQILAALRAANIIVDPAAQVIDPPGKSEVNGDGNTGQGDA